MSSFLLFITLEFYQCTKKHLKYEFLFRIDFMISDGLKEHHLGQLKLKGQSWRPITYIIYELERYSTLVFDFILILYFFHARNHWVDANIRNSCTLHRQSLLSLWFLQWWLQLPHDRFRHTWLKHTYSKVHPWFDCEYTHLFYCNQFWNSSTHILQTFFTYHYLWWYSRSAVSYE